MAVMIETIDSVDLERFIRNVRNILWINLLLEQMKRAFMIASVFILTAGLIHAFFISVSLQSLSILIASTILLAVFFTFKKKPALSEAAVSTDERLGSGTLITTAFELVYYQPKPLPELSPWVVRQAAQTVRSNRRPGLRLFLEIPSLPWSALILSMFGFFFIVQPGKSTRLQNGVRQETQLNENIPPSKHVDALIDAVRREAVDIQARTDAASVASNSDAIAQEGQEPEPPIPVEKQKLDADAVYSEYRGDSAASNSDAFRRKPDMTHLSPDRSSGRGLGAGKDTHPESARYRQVPFKSRYHIDITLKDGEPVNDDEQTAPLRPQRLPEQHRAVRFVPESTETRRSTVWNPSFAFSEQYYVETYFKELRSEQ